MPAARTGRPITPIGVAPAHVGRFRRVVETHDGPWLLVDHRDDPTQSRGKLPVPTWVLTMLRDWDAAGVRPDYLVLGHQMPAEWRDGDPVPAIPSPPGMRDREAQLTQQLDRATGLLGAFTRGLLMLSVAPMVIPALAAAGMGGATAVGTDPVIFAGVRHPQVPLVEWCYLCRWDWE